MNARRRELFGLVLAGLIASVALATVTLARDAEISPDVVTWGALFLGLYVVAHVVIRRTVPYRRRRAAPAHRGADGVRRDDDLPPRPRRRRTTGSVDRGRRRGARRDADLAASRLPRPRVVPVPLRRRRGRAAAPPLGARPRRDGQRRAAVGGPRRDPVPAGRAREDLPDPLPRRLPPREARVARARAAEGHRAAAGDLGRGDARHRRHQRPRAARS